MATIRQRTKSRWEAQVRKRGWPTQTRTFTTKADAQQWASERESEMRRGSFVDTSNLRVVTVRSIMERYLAEVTPKKKGAEPERYRLRALLRHPMASLTLDRVNTAVVVEWRNARELQVSPDTVRREMNILSSVFSTALAEWNLPVSNPVKGVRRPKEGVGRSRRPDWAELRRLFRELSPRKRGDGTCAGSRNPWVRHVVLFALRTAMRRGEILAMRWQHVHYGQHYVRVPDSKNGEARSVPLGRKAEALLRRLPRHSGSDAVFPVSASALKQAYARAVTVPQATTTATSKPLPTRTL